MDEPMRMKTCIVSCPNNRSEKVDLDFYINGRSKYEFESCMTQISVDSTENEFLLALFNHMQVDTNNEHTSIFASKELKRFQHRDINKEDFQSRVAQLKDSIAVTDSMIRSLISDEIERKEEKRSFASILLTGNKAVALEIGGYRIYHVRNRQMQQISNAYEEKELENKETIRSLTPNYWGVGNQTLTLEKNETEVFVSKTIETKIGDKFLIISDVICKVMDESMISSIMISSNDPHFIANMIIQEAKLNHIVENMTVLASIIETASENKGAGFEQEWFKNRISDKHQKDKNTRKEKVALYLITGFCCLSLIGLSVVGFSKIFPRSQSQNLLLKTTNQNVSENSVIPEKDFKIGKGEIEKELEKTEQGISASLPIETTPAIVKKEAITHVVERGDTIYTIAKKYYGDVSKYKLILQENKITDPNRILLGQRLVIPEKQ